MSHRKLLLHVFAVLFSLTIAACEATPTPPTSSGETATVIDVIDGDTIDVRFGDGREARVRYIGVNTPERGEPCFGEARDANAALVAGRTVTLVTDRSDTDRNGRLLRYVYAGETFVNAQLVRDGYAEARRYPPDTAQAELLEALEAEARAANRNCYATGVFNATAGGEPYICADGVPCIKGNVNQQGERYYHFPGCSGYEQTTITEGGGERFFATSDEAEAAGWRRAPGCP
jgi:endonuclease YncB( thermonuclease family)